VCSQEGGQRGKPVSPVIFSRYYRVVAEPARGSGAPAGVPSHDPDAVERAYVVHRARRHARVRRKRARRYARLRFFVVMLLLLALCIYIGLTVWREIEHLFGI
jgi:hypothetical protein